MNLTDDTKIKLSIKQLKKLVSDYKEFETDYDTELDVFERLFHVFDNVVANIDYLQYILRALPEQTQKRLENKLKEIQNAQAKMCDIIQGGYADFGYAPNISWITIKSPKSPKIEDVKKDIFAVISLTKDGIANARDRCQVILDSFDFSQTAKQELLDLVVSILSEMQSQLMIIEDKIIQAICTK